VGPDAHRFILWATPIRTPARRHASPPLRALLDRHPPTPTGNNTEETDVRKIIPTAATLAAAAVIASAATATTSAKTEHFSLINSQTSGSAPLHYSAIATGAFTAGGTAILDSKAGTGTLRFQGGTIKLKTKHTPTKTTGNPRTCLEKDAQSGTYTIASGTGVYKGISGSGKSTAEATFVGATVNGKCSNNTQADAIQIIVTASGPVALP
jgi:hypothetical protein